MTPELIQMLKEHYVKMIARDRVINAQIHELKTEIGRLCEERQRYYDEQCGLGRLLETVAPDFQPDAEQE